MTFLVADISKSIIKKEDTKESRFEYDDNEEADPAWWFNSAVGWISLSLGVVQIIRLSILTTTC